MAEGPAGKELFRREALERQGERLWGEPVLDLPVPLRLCVLLLAAITLAALVFLAVGDYRRKQEVQGYLVPDRGLVEVAPPREGLLLGLPLRHGQAVEKGELLFEVQVDRRVDGAVPLSEALMREVALQEGRLRERITLEREGLRLRLSEQAARRRGLETERTRLRQLIALETDLAELQGRQLERARTLQRAGALPLADVEAVRAQRLERDKTLQSLRREEDRLAAALEAGLLEAAGAEVASGKEILRLEAELAELGKQGLSLRGGSRDKVFAPVAGHVTSLGASAGQFVSTRQAVVSLVPREARLEAELLVPSRAVAFLRPGQPVNLRFDAFPYQKFGVQAGVLREVAENASIAGGEAVYRARARLAAQSVQAYGEAVTLLPGMRLSADIVLEERSLLGWLLDPLLSLRGRL